MLDFFGILLPTWDQDQIYCNYIYRFPDPTSSQGSKGPGQAHPTGSERPLGRGTASPWRIPLAARSTMSTHARGFAPRGPTSRLLCEASAAMSHGGAGATPQNQLSPARRRCTSATRQHGCGGAAACVLTFSLCVTHSLLPMAGGFSVRGGGLNIGSGTPAPAGGAGQWAGRGGRGEMGMSHLRMHDGGLRRWGGISSGGMRFPVQELRAGEAGWGGREKGWRRMAVVVAAWRTATVLAAEKARGGQGETRSARIGSVRIPSGQTEEDADEDQEVQREKRQWVSEWVRASLEPNTGRLSDEQAALIKKQIKEESKKKNTGGGAGPLSDEQAAQIKKQIKEESKKKDTSSYKSDSILQGDGKYLSSLYRYTDDGRDLSGVYRYRRCMYTSLSLSLYISLSSLDRYTDGRDPSGADR
jgi:hypothetical protein